MGRVRNLLSSLVVKARSDKCTDMFSMEICEDFHLHWRNVRLQFDKEEWLLFMKACSEALKRYISLGSPDPKPTQKLPIYLSNGKFKPICGITPESFRIEDDDLNGESVHVHLRFLRLDLSHEEFLEMADSFTAAAQKLRDGKK